MVNKGEVMIVKRKKVVIAVELTNNEKVKRVYIKTIDDYSSKSLTPIFEEHISKSAKIITDKWRRGYKSLKKKCIMSNKFIATMELILNNYIL